MLRAEGGAGYGYDALNQLSEFHRGTLNGTKDGLAGASTHDQGWQYDALGNWGSFTSDGTADTRTHNRQNQVTSSSVTGTPSYDSNGNTTWFANPVDSLSVSLVYDAWNRVAQASSALGTATYSYDALGRRLQEYVAGGPSPVSRDLYYSAAWQVVEEREGALVRAQNVWSPVYVDALVLRDRDPGGVGTLTERLYVQQDANWDVTAVVNTAGAPVERYVYDAFGEAAAYSPGWVPLGGPSAYGWVYLHQGGRLDTTSSLYGFRMRDYSPTLGRWMENDPAGYVDGTNLYKFVRNNPTGQTDPLGLGPSFGCWSAKQCFELWQKMLRTRAELVSTLAKYDPIEDAKGGHRHRYGITVPGGHKEKIEKLQAGLKKQIGEFNAHCRGQGRRGPHGRDIADLWELANRPLPNARPGTAPDTTPLVIVGEVVIVVCLVGLAFALAPQTGGGSLLILGV